MARRSGQSAADPCLGVGPALSPGDRRAPLLARGSGARGTDDAPQPFIARRAAGHTVRVIETGEQPPHFESASFRTAARTATSSSTGRTPSLASSESDAQDARALVLE